MEIEGTVSLPDFFRCTIKIPMERIKKRNEKTARYRIGIETYLAVTIPHAITNAATSAGLVFIPSAKVRKNCRCNVC